MGRRNGILRPVKRGDGSDYPKTDPRRIGSAGTTARLTVGNGVNSEEALHIDGAVPIIRLLSKGTLRWGWLGEFPTAGQSTFWNYTNGKALLTLNSAGRVGVGGTNPSSRLTVGDGVTGDEAVNIDAGGPTPLCTRARRRRSWCLRFPDPPSEDKTSNWVAYGTGAAQH